jgi:cytoskeletal protein CcmA (bactofilin family)
MAERTLIGESTFLRGLIRGDGDLEIAGRVEGEIAVSGEILIQPTAVLKANLRGHRIVVRGSIAGDLVALQAIHLEAGARVVGSLQAPAIAIGEGALIRGRVETGPTEGPTAQRPPAPVVQRAPPPAAQQRPTPRPESARTEPARTEPPRAEPPRTELAPRRDSPRAEPRREVALGIDPPRGEIPRTEASRTGSPLPPPRPAPPVPPPRPPAPRSAPTLPALSPPARPLPPPPPPPPAVEATAGVSHPEEAPQDFYDDPPPPVVPALKKGIRGAMKQRQR